MEIVETDNMVAESIPDITMKNIFDESAFKGARTKFGMVTIPPGARVPIEGMGAHDGDEYSIILKGSINTNSGGKEYQVSAGQATLIPKGEEHYAFNNGEEDCVIVFALVTR